MTLSVAQRANSRDRGSPLRRQQQVRCRRAEEAAITVGVPQIAADFAAMPQSAGAGHEWKSGRRCRRGKYPYHQQYGRSRSIETEIMVMQVD
jgi:hypothetical protein